MLPYNVIVTDGLDEIGQAILRSSTNLDDRTGISPEELLQVIENYDAMIVRSRTKVTAQVLDAAPHLKVIGRGWCWCG